MHSYHSPSERPKSSTVVAIGSFDGVHLGHQVLLRTLKEQAKQHKVPSVVFTFDPPARVLMQGIPYLSTLPEKLAQFAQAGIDEVIAVPFTREFAAQDKSVFLQHLQGLNPQAIVVGEDFAFGRGRAGTVADLAGITPKLLSLPMYTLHGEEVKSTHIRRYLQQGDIHKANALLGRSYEASGVVVQGKQLGRSIGFPTANVAVPEGKILPLGVYAVRCVLAGNVLLGMANVGNRPTVSGENITLEVHLFDFDGDIYGAEIEVRFESFIRAEQKFSGIAELKQQLFTDLHTAKEMLCV